MKEYLETPKHMGIRGRYQISVETDDLTVLNDVSKVLMNQLVGSEKEYRIEYRFETKASSFIRWLLR